MKTNGWTAEGENTQPHGLSCGTRMGLPCNCSRKNGWTAGPWQIVQDAPENPKARYQIGHMHENGTCATYVCTVKTEKHVIRDGRETANAQLIAAAPELVEALRDLMKSCQKWAPTIDRSRAESALKKAGAL